MEKLTLSQAYSILFDLFMDDSHHTMRHSIDVLRIGRKIAGKRLTQDLECALILHDIGYFIADDALDSASHCVRARYYLEMEGIHQPEILLPIFCHEANERLDSVCREDILFPTHDEDRGQKILWSCHLVCEADIISHMCELLNEKFTDGENYSECFINLLNSGGLPASSKVIYPLDKILYILCGLSLIKLKESRDYLIKTKLLQHLILRLPVECRSRVSKIIQIKYAFLQEMT